jgi:hypothetical protein
LYSGGGVGGRRSLKTLRFKLPPPAPAAPTGAQLRQKRTIMHVFHPVFPFAMSISQARQCNMTPSDPRVASTWSHNAVQVEIR